MTPLADILAAATRKDGGLAVDIPADWMQGRTAYGGISTAIALHGAMGIESDLPPLRSAQISFIGPLAGTVRISATKLRRGRNAAFIQSDVTGAGGLGLRATFVFMNAIASRIAHDATPPAPVAPPPDDAELFTGPENHFTGNFDFFDSGGEAGDAEWLRWGRLRARDGLHPMVELMAIADALPPAAYTLMEGSAPLSSLSWIVNLLDTAPNTDNGWWLLRAETDRARDGYSSQRMTIWNARGEKVAEGMQGVAIFG
ncbi:thioesterase family protein [Stakelama sp. CBK3Z-3]|uniref:Thioesterase family protein n=1 Tax=Stakelama flava TaxID=2860338 RepID=A0ABS6XIW2_9SPHN|nr:thioesterase family protein [Stakelama flava]MBW4329400.1 thioesterase family protein [Stakelama flava]